MSENISILYVEDDNAVVQFVKLLFKKNNISNVTYAVNGKEALEVYKTDDFDLVMTDMIMPVMDGFELIEEIKKINPKQIFMMVTGLDNKADLVKAIELRINFFIEKPINPKKFNQTLKDCIYVINQRKELALSNSLLTQYKDAIDSSTILSKADIKGKITYANEQFCKISKYSLDELIGQSHSILRDPNIPASVFKDMWKTITSKKQWRGTLSNIAKDGSIYIVDALIIPILDSDDEIMEYIAIRHDVTELELYKNDLKHQLDIAVEDVVDTQKEVVFTMGAIGETRSKETGNHVKRVAEYSYLLAILAGLSEDEAQLLKLASPMHDIGKVGIADSILNKPGRLTPEEFEIMKTHSQLGYDMLKGSSRDILKTSAIVAYQHHERWDGKGYPNRLVKEEIHIYGRITAICDVFDALGADRCYKKAWSLEKILKLFRVESGQQFDPKLMELFLENLDSFLSIRD
ncbi:MAG: response regulator, partial [Campylobacterota bacterium]|nr:response regulator [Campylobacterota bacterium]